MALDAEDVALWLSVGLLLSGAATATFSTSPLKRVGGVALALCGAIVCLTAMHVSPALLTAGAGAAFALASLGVALAVRAHEAYGGGDISDYDAADRAQDLRDEAK